MSACQERIADHASIFYNASDSANNKFGAKYKEVMDKLDEEARTHFDSTFRASVLDPILQYNGYFPQINEIIKKRGNKLLDYDAARSKVRKLVEKPSDDPTKLPKVTLTCV